MSMKPEGIDNKFVEIKPNLRQEKKEQDTPLKILVPMTNEGSNKTETENKPNTLPAKASDKDTKEIEEKLKKAIMEAEEAEKNQSEVEKRNNMKRQFEA